MKKVLFVGAFNLKSHNVKGGQLAACTSIINSHIFDDIKFELVDSTMESLPPPHLLKRLWNSLKRFVSFVYLLTRNKYDAVLIFTSYGLGFWEKGVMVIVSKIFRNRVILSPRSGFIAHAIDKSFMTSCFAKLVFGLSDKIICQSDSWAKYYAKFVQNRSQSIVIIKNWIVLDQYLKLEKVTNSNNKVVFLFMAWVEKEKGIYDLIEAVLRYRNELENAIFEICGDGGEIEAAKEKVKKNGLEKHFKFNGWISGDVKLDYYTLADIFVLPSHAEGLPNAMLEAMASKCAVLATKVGAIPDVIENNVNGVLVGAGDVDHLGKSLVKLYNDKRFRECLTNAAFKTVLNEHSAENQLSKLQKIL